MKSKRENNKKNVQPSSWHRPDVEFISVFQGDLIDPECQLITNNFRIFYLQISMVEKRKKKKSPINEFTIYF